MGSEGLIFWDGRRRGGRGGFVLGRRRVRRIMVKPRRAGRVKVGSARVKSGHQERPSVRRVGSRDGA